MIAHTSIELADWPPVKAEMLTAQLEDIVRVHYQTHGAGRVCLESRTKADTATVLDLITNAVHRQHAAKVAARRELKKQHMTHRREHHA